MANGMSKKSIKQETEVITVYGYEGYREDKYTKSGKRKPGKGHVRPGSVSVWAEQDSLTFTPTEARRVAKMLVKAAKTAEKVGN